MYNKLSAASKRRLYNYEDAPPDKKLISDGDIFIKQLAEKQKKTKVTLEELTKNHFYKATEEISVTAYASGPRSLEEFNIVVKHSEHFEKLKSQGLTNEEIELFLDHQKEDFLKNKHKNLSEDVLRQRLEDIGMKIGQQPRVEVEELGTSRRLQTELMLSTKPNSTETRLMKFALENNKQSREKLPGPMDHILEIEHELKKDLSSVNINKIRRKARSLAKQIETVKQPEPKIMPKHSDTGEWTNWDVKNKKYSASKETKIFTCKPLNYYTIKDGQIVKINSPSPLDVKKLTLEEIKTLPKFENYEKGKVSKTLFLKNLANGVKEADLDKIFENFLHEVVSVKVMTGRMQGQAFIEFKSEESAEMALDYCNGTFVKNKPVIMQFGRKKS